MKKTQDAAIVDPVDPDQVLKAVKDEDVNLTSILTTHHHWDHAGGHKEMLKRKSDLKVYGNDERIYGVTHQINHGFTFQLGSLKIRSLFTPCHTTGHFCYYVEDEDHPSLFSGDTLFLAGCGKFFEGTGKEMYHALINVLSKLPDKTKVYCGHEYSVSSLAFALHTQPDNQSCKDKLSWAKAQRDKGLPCVPSLLSEEKSYNPFMRVDEISMQKRCGTSNGVDTMTYLRDEKDHFKNKP